MSLIPVVVGYVSILALSLIVIATAFWAFVALGERWASLHESKIRELAMADFARGLHSDSYWFSEHPPTMGLLRAIADSVGRSRACGINVDQIREKWRRDINAAVTEAASSK